MWAATILFGLILIANSCDCRSLRKKRDPSSPFDFNNLGSLLNSAWGSITNSLSIGPKFSGTETGVNILGSGFNDKTGLSVENKTYTIGKSDGVKAIGQNVFGTSDQASLDFSKGDLPKGCIQKDNGLFGKLFNTNSGGCLDLGGFGDLFGGAKTTPTPTRSQNV